MPNRRPSIPLGSSAWPISQPKPTETGVGTQPATPAFRFPGIIDLDGTNRVVENWFSDNNALLKGPNFQQYSPLNNPIVDPVVTPTSSRNIEGNGPFGPPATRPGSISPGQFILGSTTPGAPAPNATSVSPVAGGTAGSTAITIIGSNLGNVTAVSVGGVACTSVVASNLSVTCVTGANTVGAKDVVVTGEAGLTTTLSGVFTYVAAPTVTSITNNSGSGVGNEQVTIVGTSFVIGATTVAIGGAACTAVVVASATSLTCTTPSSATTGAKDVVATTVGGAGTLAAGYTYNSTSTTAPTITSITPNSGTGTGEASVTIVGSSFLSPLATSVGIYASDLVSIAITSGSTPGAEGVEKSVDNNVNTKYLNYSGAGTGYVVELNSASDVVGLQLTTANDATARDPASFSLYGSNTGTSGPWTTIVSASALSPPSGRKTAYPAVSFSNGTSYLYYKLIFDTVRTPGNYMQIAEAIMLARVWVGQTTVTVGGNPCTNVTVGFSTSLTCNVPTSSTAGAKDVVVTTSGGSATLSSGFTYTAPLVTLWTPAELGSDVQLWLDAETDVTESGGAVSSWGDSSTHNRDVAQSTASRQPAYGATQLNGKPSVTFDGNDHLFVAGLSSTPSGFYTVFALCNSTQSSGTNDYIMDTTNRTIVSTITSSAQPGYYDGSFRSGGGNATGIQLVSWVIADDGDIYRNGTSIYSPTFTLSARNLDGQIGIGSRYDYDSSNGWIGDLSEFVVVSGELSDADRQKVEGYLAWRWTGATTDLVAALPADHPYKSAAPTI